MKSAGTSIATLFAYVIATLAFSARADEALWATLNDGGRVILIRHAITTPGVGDPPGMRLDDCSTQRNLTDAGRQHARAIGTAFRARRVPIDRVLSSPWCRCLDTARLAFDQAEVEPSLGNLFDRPELRAPQIQALHKRIAHWHAQRKTGGNLVLVSHGSTIAALTGVAPGTGELVIATPRADGTVVAAGTLSLASP
jgi:broad specificity phosphatase PhoE